jgi:hypothetical protein
MRITVLHKRKIEDARRHVERAVEKLATINLAGAIEISRVEKRWSGTTLEFSLYAAVGPFRSPIRGMAIVREGRNSRHRLAETADRGSARTDI